MNGTRTTQAGRTERRHSHGVACESGSICEEDPAIYRAFLKRSVSNNRTGSGAMSALGSYSRSLLPGVRRLMRGPGMLPHAV
jgi:hypothetical protein